MGLWEDIIIAIKAIENNQVFNNAEKEDVNNMQLQEIKVDTMNGNLQLKDKQLNRLAQLEKEYNWYQKKVILIPEGATFKDLKRAVGGYFQKKERLSDENIKHHAYGFTSLDNNEDVSLSIALGWGNSDMSISVKKLESGFALIQVNHCSGDTFLRDMYRHVDTFLNNLAEKKCPGCGAKIVGEGKFCASCGHKF